MNYYKLFSSLFLLITAPLFSQTEQANLETIVQTGHYGTIMDVDYSPDGKLVATASADNTIILWEVATGRELKTLIGHTDYLQSVRFSPDGKEIISVANDKKAILWNIGSGSITRVFSDSTDEIRSAIFSPKGTYILTGGHKTNAILWDRASGQKLKTYKNKIEVCYQCASDMSFSADESKIYTSSEDNNILIWNTQKADTISTIRFAKGSCSSCNSYLAIDPSGNTLAQADYSGHLYMVDAKSKKIIKQLTPEEEDFNSVQFSSNGNYLLTLSGYYGVVKVWDIKSGKVLHEMKEDNYKIKSSKFSPDGKQFITAGGDHTAKLWQTDTKTLVRTFKGIVERIEKPGISGDELYYINLLKDTELSPDGKLIAQCKRGNDVIIWDFYTGRIIKTLSGHESTVTGLSFSSNSEMLATAGADRYIKLWNVKTGKEIRSIEAHSAIILSIKFSKDGRYLISGGWDGVFNIWDVATGKRVSYGTQQGGSPYAINFTPNNLYAVTSGNTSESKLKITELDTKQEIKNLIGHTDIVQSIEFSPAAENTMLTASFDGSAKLWNIETGFQTRKLSGHQGAVHAATFDATGEYIVTGSRDKTAKLWNAKTGELIRTFKGHTGSVNYVQITPDGKCLVTAARDRSVKIWDLKTGKLLITHVTFENKQWLAKTEDGYFEGTPEALKMLYFVKGIQSFSLDQFFEKLYKPGLYKKALAMETEQGRSADVSSLLEQSPPPMVDVLSQKAGLSKEQYKEIIIKITNTGGGIDEVRFLQNGKRLDIPNQLERALPKKDQDITLTYSVGLIPGKNQITVTAFSKGRVESKPVVLEFTYEGAKKTSNLYILAIGINEYKNAQLSLNYAKADAQAFLKSMEENSKTLFNKTESFVLLDSTATKQNIVAKLNEIKQKATKEDVFYFYYAGHGSTMQQEFYFVPTECVSLYQEEKLMKEAISATELNQKLKEIAALKQVVILDACHSGASTKILASRGLTEEKALAQLARSSGIHIMAAAGSEQQAIEFSKLGHGLFTYVLLEAMNGQADGAPQDNKVTIYELKSFIDDQVPELSKQYQGTTQYPSTFSLGQDFPMVITPEKK